LTRLGEEAFSRLHFVQPSSSPSRVKRSLPLTTKSSSEKSPNFLETTICRAPQVLPVWIDFEWEVARGRNHETLDQVAGSFKVFLLHHFILLGGDTECGR